ncbi:MAG: hypothetical protein ACR5KW_03045 [Wolbachia sp.]
MMKLIEIFKDIGIDFKKRYHADSKFEVLFERLFNNQKIENIHLIGQQTKKLLAYIIISHKTIKRDILI